MKDINRQNKNTKNTKNTLPATFLNLAATATKTNTKLHFAGLQSFKQGKTISILYYMVVSEPGPWAGRGGVIWSTKDDPRLICDLETYILHEINLAKSEIFNF